MSEAQSLFQEEAKVIGDQQGLKKNWTEDDLKKLYLKLAKRYHPDVSKTGNKLKFQKVQEAYDRLQAGQDGYTYTEEDLYDMYTRQSKRDKYYENEKQEWYESYQERQAY